MLRRFQQAGKPHELQVFPGVDHGMRRFTEHDGKRVTTGYTPGYFAAEVAAARRLSGLGPAAGLATSIP